MPKPSRAGVYKDFSVVSHNGHRYALRTTGEVSPDDDPFKLFRTFQAEISKIAPYDDANYVWAKIGKGETQYFMEDEFLDRAYYMTPWDWDLENSEWVETIIESAILELEEYNKNISPKMVHN